VFSGTNLSDPGGASDTHQPLGFDEMALWYTNYMFHSSEIRIVASYGSNNIAPVATAIGGDILVYPNSSASASSILVDALVQPGVKSSRLTIAKVGTILAYGDMKSVIGLQNYSYDGSVGTTASGLAAFNWFWHFGRASEAAYTDIALEYTIQITYDVTFFNRKLLAIPTLEREMSKFLRGERMWLASGKPEPGITQEHDKVMSEKKSTLLNGDMVGKESKLQSSMGTRPPDKVGSSGSTESSRPLSVDGAKWVKLQDSIYMARP
jgi:hypothetical protein